MTVERSAASCCHLQPQQQGNNCMSAQELWIIFRVSSEIMKDVHNIRGSMLLPVY